MTRRRKPFTYRSAQAGAQTHRRPSRVPARQGGSWDRSASAQRRLALPSANALRENGHFSSACSECPRFNALMAPKDRFNSPRAKPSWTTRTGAVCPIDRSMQSVWRKGTVSRVRNRGPVEALRRLARRADEHCGGEGGGGGCESLAPAM
jgi:hypothetical protein